MPTSLPCKTLSRLGLCLLLTGNLLVWSIAWNVPVFHGGQFEQLGDCSPPFLVGSGDGSSGEDACIDSTTGKTGNGWARSPTPALAPVAVAARIRSTSYPVLSRAPPAFS